MTMPIVSVNTGRVAPLGQVGDRQVDSAIRKAPVFGGTSIYLHTTGLDGDEQADPRVHGHAKGKTVYFYPRDHYALWVAEKQQVLVPGDFGENVTVDGWDETTVTVGQQWRWGDAVLEVTGPRRPCFKLELLRGEGTAAAMMSNGRCGWYCKVLEPGWVPTRGELELIASPTGAPSILRVFREKTRRDASIPGITG